MFRSSPPEVFSKKGTVQIRSEPTGKQTHRSAIPTKPLCVLAKHLSPGEHLWETAPVCQNSFKRLKL